MTVTLQELTEELHSWKSCRYGAGMREKRCGVDCVNFSIAIFDFVDGKQTPTIKLPSLLGYSSKIETIKAMKSTLRNFEYRDIDHSLAPSILKPADCIFMRDGQDPVHLGIVGYEKGTLWHSSRLGILPGQSGVNCVSIKCAIDRGIFRVWRLNSAKLDYEK